MAPRPVLHRDPSRWIARVQQKSSLFLPWSRISSRISIHRSIQSSTTSWAVISSPWTSLAVRWPSVDKFRLKFRELFARCCCQNMDRLKSNSSTMIPFKSTSLIQPSPMSINNHNNQRRSSRLTNTLTVNADESRSLVNHPVRSHPPSPLNALPTTRNGSISFHLTNVWHDSVETKTVIVRELSLDQPVNNSLRSGVGTPTKRLVTLMDLAFHFVWRIDLLLYIYICIYIYIYTIHTYIHSSTLIYTQIDLNTSSPQHDD